VFKSIGASIPTDNIIKISTSGDKTTVKYEDESKKIDKSFTTSNG